MGLNLAESRFAEGSDLASTIESIATVVGLAVGGFWVYLKFIRDRVYRPRFDVSIHAGYTRVNSSDYLAAAVLVKNIGTGKIALVQEGTGLRLSTGEHPDDSYRQPKWTVQRVYRVFEQHEWVESGETIRHDSLIRMQEPGPVLLEVRLVCERRHGTNITVYSRAVVTPDMQWTQPAPRKEEHHGREAEAGV